MAASNHGAQNPFGGVMDLTSEMHRMSDQTGGAGSDTTLETQARTHVDAWNPATDVLARGEDLVIRMELPGVVTDDLDVSLSNGLLTVAGERPARDDGASYYRRECFWGTFRRSITIPPEITEEHISAQVDDGLLEITVKGGAEAEGPRKIRITSKPRRRSIRGG